MGTGIGGGESSEVKERKHEALATVRLVNKDGDVLWSTTQESGGAKFHGASEDVAEKMFGRALVARDRTDGHVAQADIHAAIAGLRGLIGRRLRIPWKCANLFQTLWIAGLCNKIRPADL